MNIEIYKGELSGKINTIQWIERQDCMTAELNSASNKWIIRRNGRLIRKATKVEQYSLHDILIYACISGNEQLK